MNLDRFTARRLPDILVDQGIVSAEQVEKVQALRPQGTATVAEGLVASGFVTETDVARLLASQFQLPFIRAAAYEVGQDLLALVPLRQLVANRLLPLDRFGEILVLAAADIPARELVDEIQGKTGCRLQFYVSTFSELRRGLERYFGEQLRGVDDPLEPPRAVAVVSGKAAPPRGATSLPRSEGPAGTSGRQPVPPAPAVRPASEPDAVTEVATGKVAASSPAPAAGRAPEGAGASPSDLLEKTSRVVPRGRFLSADPAAERTVQQAKAPAGPPPVVPPSDRPRKPRIRPVSERTVPAKASPLPPPAAPKKDPAKAVPVESLDDLAMDGGWESLFDEADQAILRKLESDEEGTG